MTIREVLDIVQGIYSKGVPSDDSRLRDRQIYNKVIRLRSLLLSQKANKRQPIGQWNYQTIEVEFQKADTTESTCTPASGMYILKSKQELPAIITHTRGYLIDSVTSLDGSQVYGLTKWETKKYQKANKYTSNKPDYLIRDGRLMITSQDYPERITLTAVFADPLLAYRFSECCSEDGGVCMANQDYEFPLDQDIIDAIADMSQQELIKMFYETKADNINNSVDDTTLVK